jgi:hypothetical protein
MTDHSLPVGDRDEATARRRGETDGEYLRRRVIEDHGIDPGDDAIAARDEEPACSCLARGIVCQHEPSYEERMARLYGTPAEDMSDVLERAGREVEVDEPREDVRPRRRGGKKSQLELRVAALEETLKRLRERSEEVR